MENSIQKVIDLIFSSIFYYTVKSALVKIRIICLYKEVTIPSGIKVIYIALYRPKTQS